MVKQTIFIFTVRGNITGCAAAGRDRETVVLRRSSPQSTHNCTHTVSVINQPAAGDLPAWYRSAGWAEHAWPEKQFLHGQYQIIEKMINGSQDQNTQDNYV